MTTKTKLDTNTKAPESNREADPEMVSQLVELCNRDPYYRELILWANEKLVD